MLNQAMSSSLIMIVEHRGARLLKKKRAEEVQGKNMAGYVER